MSLCELETNTILPMRYLKKDPQSPMIGSKLSYDRRSDRPKIRARLLLEQRGFCAYSERFIKATDETHIEHFDPRQKGTPQDGYFNWYAVLPRFNSQKPKQIEPFLPILSPNSPDLSTRVAYQTDIGVFQAVDPNDIEAKNLVKFLKLDSYELFEDCQNHLKYIKVLRDSCADEVLFLQMLKSNKENLNFASALEALFGIDVVELLNEID